MTEEGRLLQNIQGDEVGDYDIDAYAGRLQEILDRKVIVGQGLGLITHGSITPLLHFFPSHRISPPCELSTLLRE